jgi:hypothetical protein
MQNRYSVPVPAAVGSPLDQVRSAFDGLTCGPNPVSVDGREVRGMPARPIRLDEVRDRLRERGCPGATRDAVWALLVHRARIEGEAWTIACLGCALPDLISASRQLSRGLPHTLSSRGLARPIGRARSAVAGVPDYLPGTGGGGCGGYRWSALDAAADTPTVGGGHQACRSGVSASSAVCDVEAAVLAGFLAELMVVDLTRPRVLGRLRSAAHEAGVLARREITGAAIPRARLFSSYSPRSSARHPDLVLARAVAARAITRGEAALIGATRLEPTSLAEVAVRRGQPYRDVRAARIRAERKLSVFLRDQDTGSIETFLSRTDTGTSTTRSGTGTRVGVGGENPRGKTRRRSRCRAITARRTDPQPTAPGSTPGPASAQATQARSPAQAPTGHRRNAATAATVTPAPLPPTLRRRIRRRRGVALPATLPSPTSPASPISGARASSAPTPARPGRLDAGSTAEPVVPGPDAATVDATATDATALIPSGRAVAGVASPSCGDRS